MPRLKCSDFVSFGSVKRVPNSAKEELVSRVHLFVVLVGYGRVFKKITGINSYRMKLVLVSLRVNATVIAAPPIVTARMFCASRNGP